MNNSNNLNQSTYNDNIQTFHYDFPDDEKKDMDIGQQQLIRHQPIQQQQQQQPIKLSKNININRKNIVITNQFNKINKNVVFDKNLKQEYAMIGKVHAQYFLLISNPISTGKVFASNLQVLLLYFALSQEYFFNYKINDPNNKKYQNQLNFLHKNITNNNADDLNKKRQNSADLQDLPEFFDNSNKFYEILAIIINTYFEGRIYNNPTGLFFLKKLKAINIPFIKNIEKFLEYISKLSLVAQYSMLRIAAIGINRTVFVRLTYIVKYIEYFNMSEYRHQIPGTKRANLALFPFINSQQLHGVIDKQCMSDLDKFANLFKEGFSFFKDFLSQTNEFEVDSFKDLVSLDNYIVAAQTRYLEFVKQNVETDILLNIMNQIEQYATKLLLCIFKVANPKNLDMHRNAIYEIFNWIRYSHIYFVEHVQNVHESPFIINSAFYNILGTLNKFMIIMYGPNMYEEVRPNSIRYVTYSIDAFNMTLLQNSKNNLIFLPNVREENINYIKDFITCWNSDFANLNYTQTIYKIFNAEDLNIDTIMTQMNNFQISNTNETNKITNSKLYLVRPNINKYGVEYFPSNLFFTIFMKYIMKHAKFSEDRIRCFNAHNVISRNAMFYKLIEIYNKLDDENKYTWYQILEYASLPLKLNDEHESLIQEIAYIYDEYNDKKMVKDNIEFFFKEMYKTIDKSNNFSNVDNMLKILKGGFNYMSLIHSSLVNNIPINNSGITLISQDIVQIINNNTTYKIKPQYAYNLDDLWKLLPQLFISMLQSKPIPNAVFGPIFNHIVASTENLNKIFDNRNMEKEYKRLYEKLKKINIEGKCEMNYMMFQNLLYQWNVKGYSRNYPLNDNNFLELVINTKYEILKCEILNYFAKNYVKLNDIYVQNISHQFTKVITSNMSIYMKFDELMKIRQYIDKYESIREDQQKSMQAKQDELDRLQRERGDQFKSFDRLDIPLDPEIEAGKKYIDQLRSNKIYNNVLPTIGGNYTNTLSSQQTKILNQLREKIKVTYNKLIAITGDIDTDFKFMVSDILGKLNKFQENGEPLNNRLFLEFQKLIDGYKNNPLVWSEIIFKMFQLIDSLKNDRHSIPKLNQIGCMRMKSFKKIFAEFTSKDQLLMFFSTLQIPQGQQYTQIPELTLTPRNQPFNLSVNDASQLSRVQLIYLLSMLFGIKNRSPGNNILVTNWLKSSQNNTNFKGWICV